MRNIKQVSILIVLVFVFSCDNSKSTSTRDVEITNFQTLENDNRRYQYFVSDVYNNNLSISDDVNQNNVFNRLAETPKSLLLLENKIRDLTKATIEVDKSNRTQFFVLLLDNQVLDMIKITASTKTITIPEIIDVNNAGEIESGKINLIDTDLIILSGEIINDANLIFLDNSTLTLSNYQFNNCLINFNFINNEIKFTDVSVNNSHLINLSNSIDIDNDFQVTNSIIRDKIGENIAFLSSVVDVDITNTAFYNIPVLFTGNTNTFDVSYTYFKNVFDVFSFEIDNNVTINNSIFDDVRTAIDVTQGELTVQNSIFYNVNLGFLITQEKTTVQNCVFEGDINSQLLRIRYNFYLRDERAMVFTNNNISLRHNSFFIISLDEGVNEKNVINLNSCYIDFGVENLFTKILDKTTGANISGEVLIQNLQSEKINTAGILD